MLGKTGLAGENAYGLEPLPEITQQIYRKKQTNRSLDYSFRLTKACFRTLNGPAKPQAALRTPLKSANRLICDFKSEEKLKPTISSNSISPLRGEFQWIKTLVGTPRATKPEEFPLNIEARRVNQQIRPPTSAKSGTKNHRHRTLLLTTDFSGRARSPVCEPNPLYITAPSESVLKWKYSVRIAYQRRSEMATRPLVIIHFTGVLGDFCAKEPWGDSSELHLRTGWEKGLHQLASCMQVALFVDMSKARWERVREVMKRKEIHVDAMYRRRKGQAEFVQDYEQVVGDFGMAGVSASHIVILSPHHLDHAETFHRSSWSLLYEPSLSSHRRICATGLPTLTNRISMVFLAPNPRAQDPCESVCFTEVASSLLKVVDSRPGNLVKAFSSTKKHTIPRLKLVHLPFFDYTSREVLLPFPASTSKKHGIATRIRLIAMEVSGCALHPYEQPDISKKRIDSF